MKIVVNTAGVGIWEFALKPLLEKGIYPEDIHYINSLQELVKLEDSPEPFFSKKYLAYINADLFIPDIMKSDFIDYILYTEKVDVFEKLIKTIDCKFFNTYSCKRTIVRDYISSKTNLCGKELNNVMKKLSHRYGKVDEIILRVNSGMDVISYKKVNIDKFLYRLLFGKSVDFNLVYQYRFNPNFLIGLLRSKISELISLKIDIVQGKKDAETLRTNYRTSNKIIVLEHISLERLLEVEHKLVLGKNRFEGFLILTKLVKN